MITVKLRHLRISARKARLIADLIRNKSIEQAEGQLRVTIKKAAGPYRKLLKSAISTAKNDFELEKEGLYISEVKVDEGPTLKRVRPRARGAFYPIHKRTSHLTLSLGHRTKKIETKQGKKAQIQEKKEGASDKTTVPKKKVLKTTDKSSKMKLKRAGAKKFFRRKSF